MILVNTGYVLETVSIPNSQYYGLTVGDLAMPFFLFIIGVTIAYSFSNRLKTGRGLRSESHGKEDLGKEYKHKLLVHTTLRSIVLFILGILLDSFPYYNINLETLRITGPLQRIAICYLIASLAYLYLKPRYRIVLALVIPILYSLGGNLAYRIDVLVFGINHLLIYSVGTPDPEGLLSTLAASSLVLIGCLVGEYLLQNDVVHNTLDKIVKLILVASLLISVGAVWNIWQPTSKVLWTSSYNFLVAGISMLVLLFFKETNKLGIFSKFFKVFTVMGRNAIFSYMFSILFPTSLVYLNVIPYSVSLPYTILILSYVWLVDYVLYLKRIFLKV